LEDCAHTDDLAAFFEEQDVRGEGLVFRCLAELQEFVSVPAGFLLQSLLDPANDHGDGDAVFDAAWDHYICGFPLRVHMLLEVGLDERHPLLYDAFNISPSFSYIADDLLGLWISSRSL